MDDKKYENEKYNGEFIPTYFGWISLDDQKKRAEELNQKTKKHLQ